MSRLGRYVGSDRKLAASGVSTGANPRPEHLFDIENSTPGQVLSPRGSIREA